MAHVLGQLDFCIEEKEFPITLFRRKPSEIWAYVETPGHVVILTRRGKRVCELLSIETHACLSRRYDEEMAEVRRICEEYREKRKAGRKAKKHGTGNM